jgi:hypothetical protein
MAIAVPGSTGDTPPADAQSVFESLLSDEPEYREESSQTPPAQKKSPEPAEQSETDEQEADPEPAESEEDESPEQDETDEEQDEKPAAPAEKHKVKIDGEEVEVDLEELKKGYSRTQDYTRKTQDVATHRKALETETVAARQERAALAQNLKLVEEALSEITPKEPDWETIRRDHPNEFANIWSQWQQQEKDRATVKQMRAEAEQKVQQDTLKARQERMAVEQEKLLEAIPTWKDEKVKAAEVKNMVAFAQKHGWTQQDLAGFDDHRAFVILHKAMLFDQGQAKKADAVKRIETVRTTKPSGETTSRTPVSDKTRALQRLAKTHKPSDMARVFETMLDDM